MKMTPVAILWLCLALAGVPSAAALEKHIVAGAGPSTRIAGIFFRELVAHSSRRDRVFIVSTKSIKHTGGIAASDTNLFGRTGRPLTDAEKEPGKAEIFLAGIPAAFAACSGIEIGPLELEQVKRIYTGAVTRWSQVGGPDAKILVVGREPTEAVLMALRSRYPFFNSAVFTKIFHRDDQVVDFLKSNGGRFAIGFGAEPNFRNRKWLHVLDVRGFSAGVRVGLVYDLANASHPLVNAVADFADSGHWRAVVAEEGYLPPGP